MDTSRISFGEMVAAASGLALVVVMFFDWFGYDVDAGFGVLGTVTDLNAWQWMDFLDVVLFLIAVIAVGMAIARAAGSMPALPASPGQIVALAGALAVVIVLFRLVTPGDGPLVDPADVADPARKLGAFLGLIAAGGIAFGGYTAMNERTSGAAPSTGGATPPPPPPNPPASEPPRV